MPHEHANVLAHWSAHLAAASGRPVVLGSPPPSEALRSAGTHRDSVDLRLWLEACRAAPSPDVVPVGRGPLVDWDQRVAIEVWTEEELSGMHALARLARRTDSRHARERLHAAARWHIEHTQPDNGTNRPWAAHVFILEGSPEAHAYAGTLLHNALALGGQPTPLSSWILMDAAAELAESARAARAG